MERWELTRVADLLRWEQDGVVSRAQLLAHGATPGDVRRLLRRRELTVVHPGVYVNHTGGLTRVQREWAAVLLHWPAALAGTSALPGAVGDVVHVAVAATQRGGVAPGIVVTRRRDFALAVDHTRRPPRVRLE